MPVSLFFWVAIIVQTPILLGTCLGADPPNHLPSSAARWCIQLDQTTARVADGGMPVLVYQRATNAKDGKWPRANYVHPLYDLEGREITEDFPPDHPHHRGVFWAWHQVLLNGESQGDAWLCQDFHWNVTSVSGRLTPKFAELNTSVVWETSIGDRPVGGRDSVTESRQALKSDAVRRLVRERVKIQIHPVNGTGNQAYRSIDFRIALQALQPNIAIGGSNDAKGYGGFSPRIRLHPDVRFYGQHGEIEPLNTAVEVGPWVNIVWPQGGLVMISHHANPGDPNRWILRRRGSMQNAVFPGRHPVGLPTDKPLVLQYRLVIHRGQLSRATIEAIEQSFQTEAF